MINERLIKNLQKALLTNIKIEEMKPLSELCTLGTGGEAEFFIEPESKENLKAIFDFAIKEKINLYILGGGSNLIFPDGIISGIVISTKKLNNFKWIDSFKAEIQSGYKLSSIVKALPEKNLGGLEFAVGIPGTLGGAISGNAGAGGKGICEFCDEVFTLEPNGNFKKWLKGDFNFSYRECELYNNNRVIISCIMAFRKAEPDDNFELENFLFKRKNQPLKFKNAGSTFKNPYGKSAGKLLEQSNCKGLSVGDAFVSEQHANFILNRGGAKSSDVIELIKICQKRVYECTGIMLEPEIKLIGFSDRELFDRCVG